MKILVIGPFGTGGGHERTIAYKNFLESINHCVDLIQFPNQSFSFKIWYFYYQHGGSSFQEYEKGAMKKIASLLEKRIKKEHYDVVIGVENLWSYVLTRDLDCLKIFSCESLGSDELYFSNKNIDLDRVKGLREMEIEIMMKSDYVIFPWKTTENYVRRYVMNGSNFLTIKFGCYPKNLHASYFFPSSIISLGNLWGYYTNKELLSQLTQTSSFNIDVYGPHEPNKKYHLNYKGFAKTTDILSKYQFGLNTVTKDVFRRNHFSSRPLNYLAYGLPVLSPDWMQLSHELKGCVPYDEYNFVNLVNKYSERDQWEKLSHDALEQAKELDWAVTLKPLEKIITQL